MGIKPETLKKWFAETGVNKTAKEIFFGKYRVYIDDGLLVMKHAETRQIDVVKKSAIGELSENAALVLSEILEKGADEGNAGFFALDNGRKDAVYISITYGKHEVEMRFADYGLGFTLSENYCASACKGTLLVVDRMLGRYNITRADRSTLSAKLDLENDAACFMVSRDVGLICSGNEVHVIHEKVRDVIDVGELAERNGSQLSDPEIGVGFEDEHWLALKGKKWKKECLIIALSGNEKFCYGFAPLAGAFENEESSEGLRK